MIQPVLIWLHEILNSLTQLYSYILDIFYILNNLNEMFLSLWFLELYILFSGVFSKNGNVIDTIIFFIHDIIYLIVYWNATLISLLFPFNTQ